MPAICPHSLIQTAAQNSKIKMTFFVIFSAIYKCLKYYNYILWRIFIFRNIKQYFLKNLTYYLLSAFYQE